METQLMLGFEGVPYASEDFHTAQILASVIGGGMSSRLFQEVREKRGLCYSIYAFHWSFSDTGIFGVHAATGPGDVGELMPVLVGELERAAGDISDKEIARARAQLRAGLLMTLESPAGAERPARPPAAPLRPPHPGRRAGGEDRRDQHRRRARAGAPRLHRQRTDARRRRAGRRPDEPRPHRRTPRRAASRREPGDRHGLPPLDLDDQRQPDDPRAST